MKKALQDGEDLYASLREGSLYVWGKDDAALLLEAANKTLGFEILERKGSVVLKRGRSRIEVRITAEDVFGIAARDWLCRLLDRGVSENMIDELNEKLSEIRFIHVLMLSKNRTPYWKYIADLDKSWAPPEAMAAYEFANQLAIGGLADLKCCQMSDCSRFFLGRPNAKWCSTACGSRHRVRQKRKRDVS